MINANLPVNPPPGAAIAIAVVADLPPGMVAGHSDDDMPGSMRENMQEIMPEIPVTSPALPTVLCVDDEVNILSALRRLFRGKRYRVLTAESGAAALALLQHETVDVVMSDMRMPDMDGAQLLERVRQHWPDTARLLLTGYSDVPSILAAINCGEIYRYITKPWDDNDLLLVVRHAIERRLLEQDKARLEALTCQQNDALNLLNHSLELKVEARTRELKTSHDGLQVANDKLRSNFVTTVKIFSGMIEMRGGNLAGHSRRVADLARRIAVKMGMETRLVQEIFIAGLLHEIGKIGFSDELLAMPHNLMKGEQLGQFRKHPLRAEQLLMPLEELRSEAAMLRSQRERFDGGGFPDALEGSAIVPGARILALAADYDNLQIGALVQRRLPPDEARQLIYDSSGKRYDPAVVAAFRALNEGDLPEPLADLTLLSGELVAGMVLSRDLISREGFLLLSAEHVLNARLIRQVMEFEAKSDTRLSFHVWPPKEK